MTEQPALLPPTADRVPPRPVALALLTCIPHEKWVSIGQVAEAALHAGLPLSVTPDGDQVLVDGKELAWLLRGLRRHGWLIYNRHTDPPTYKRTPSGTLAAAAADRL